MKHTQWCHLLHHERFIGTQQLDSVRRHRALRHAKGTVELSFVCIVATDVHQILPLHQLQISYDYRFRAAHVAFHLDCRLFRELVTHGTGNLQHKGAPFAETPHVHILPT
uniref:Uncharacterized protein n=1 Tax=Anopheles atroparvus TaxID=41427 RepID=A0AAG5DIR7_ANOAO